MHAEQAEFADLLREFAYRHLALLEPLGDVRAQPLLPEPANHGSQFQVFVGQQGVQIQKSFECGSGHCAIFAPWIQPSAGIRSGTTLSADE